MHDPLQSTQTHVRVVPKHATCEISQTDRLQSLHTHVRVMRERLRLALRDADACPSARQVLEGMEVVLRDLALDVTHHRLELAGLSGTIGRGLPED